MSIGSRVVRGPDWELGDADGGEGHIGTIVQTNTDGTMKVQWDMGKKTMVRAGRGGKHDIRLLDSAPIGVRHENVRCDVCDDGVLLGTRWNCTECNDFNLCIVCYNTDKHNIQHAFARIDTPGSKGVIVPKRSKSVKMRALGIYVGAKVVRGPSWEYGTQDGGNGKQGEVVEMKRFGSVMAERNGVRVQWPSGERNIYRLGFKGQVDVLCVEEAPVIDYYRDHLANVDTSTASKQTGNSGKAHSDSSLRVGDKVCVFLPPDALKEVQNGHGGWSRRMTECIGEVATVKRFVGKSEVEVDCNGDKWRFYTGAVMKVHDFNMEDTVEILSNVDTVKLLQKGHGGWTEPMQGTLGKVGRVVKKDSDGDVAVAFGRQAFVYNPACCKPAPNRQTDTLVEAGGGSVDSSEDEATSDCSSGGGLDASDVLANILVKMLMADRLGSSASNSVARFASAAANGNTSLVTGLLSRQKKLVNCRHRGLTPLHLASHEGHQSVVKILLQAGANREDTDKTGNTPLLAALMGNKEEIAIFLATSGCNIGAVNQNGRTTVHIAAYENMPRALKLFLDNGCDPNKKDGAGDTALHDAIQKRNDATATLLIACPRTNLDIKNQKGFNCLCLAALKDHERAAELIVTRNPGLCNVAKDGEYTPLHIAAANNHMDTARILIKKGKANIDAREQKNMTPLHIAAHEGYLKMVELLTLSGADLGSVDKDGDTPLHMALIGTRSGDNSLLQLLGLRRSGVDNERIKVACLLIERGADLQAKNKRGATPLQVCSNEQIRNAVHSFAEKRKSEGQKTAGRSLADLLFELPIPCMACSEKLADARFMPCRHKVLCLQCCFRVDECPVCDADIEQRVDMQGRRIMRNVQCPVQ